MTISPSTIGSINLLPAPEKREIYTRLIPQELLDRFYLPERDSIRLQSLLQFNFAPGSSSVEIALFHEKRFPDPVLYGHLTDTLAGYIHVLLYVVNDPNSPRFNTDLLPDGTKVNYGSSSRNIEAEIAAMNAGLSPGQIRKGPHLLRPAIIAFEKFVDSLGHEMYFAEPLYYHNAVLFEHFGFGYQAGRKLMEKIEAGFSEKGELHRKLDNSTPFRKHQAEHSIRLRSWSIHDGILSEPFTNVTMYKHVGKSAGISTCPSCEW